MRDGDDDRPAFRIEPTYSRQNFFHPRKKSGCILLKQSRKRGNQCFPFRFVGERKIREDRAEPAIPRSSEPAPPQNVTLSSKRLIVLFAQSIDSSVRIKSIRERHHFLIMLLGIVKASHDSANPFRGDGRLQFFVPSDLVA